MLAMPGSANKFYGTTATDGRSKNQMDKMRFCSAVSQTTSISRASLIKIEEVGLKGAGIVYLAVVLAALVSTAIADMPDSYDTALNKINTPERVVRHDMHQLLVQGAISHGYIRRVHVG